MWGFIILASVVCFIPGGGNFVDAVPSNSPPVISVPGFQTVPEDTPVGSVLLQIRATDPDGDTLHFIIDSPTTDDLVQLVNQSMSSSPKTAEVVLKAELDRDYESAVRNLEFSVHDNVHTSTASVHLIITDVNDEPPKFEEPGYIVNVKESETIGHVVTTVTATDIDTGAGGQVYYGLRANGLSQNDYTHTFITEKSSGRITLNESLDYEGRTFYQYNVTAWDFDPEERNAGNHAVPANFLVTVIDVQDAPPFFRNTPYTHTISEGVPVGSFVLQVYASDGDHGHRNPIEYSFVKGDSESDSFKIDRFTGSITTAVKLDADSTEMKQNGGILTFRVNASEIFPPSQEQLGDTSSLIEVKINIEDANDNLPTFSSTMITASILENSPNGTLVTLDSPKHLMVKDVDMTKTNSDFEVFVKHNDNDFPFLTIPTRGEVTSNTNISFFVNNQLDYEQRTNVTFKIVAQEIKSAGRQSSTADVVINIIDVNDNPPRFESSMYTVTTPEDIAVNDHVIQLEAVDADSGLYGKVTYEIYGLDAGKFFEISNTTGLIKVINRLDPARRSYSMDVLAIDSDPSEPLRLTTSTRVLINIRNSSRPVGHFRSNNNKELVALGHGNFSVYMEFYKDHTYNYKYASYPAVVDLNEDVFVDLRLDSEDPSLKISLQTCYASPDSNGGNPVYYLIKDRCPSDLTVAVENAPRKHIHFRFRPFKFPSNEQDVYIFCHINVCNEVNLSDRCSNDCNPDNRKRGAVDAADFSVFQGPLRRRTRSTM